MTVPFAVRCNIGGGKVQVGIEINSFIGLMEGTVALDVVNATKGKSVTKTFTVTGLNWSDDTITVQLAFEPGDVVGAVLSGQGVIFVEGDGVGGCDIPPPSVAFRY